MGTDCATSQTGLGGIQKKPTEARIERVANGFIINIYGGGGQRIANTLPEALELIRKELE